jgi:aspartate-semialdehyde dehydrogenase
MSKSVVIAIVGATGAVGQTMLQLLAESTIDVKKLHLLASERSLGKRFEFRGGYVQVENLETFDFTGVDIGLFSAGGSISAIYAPKAAEAGCVVIDNTSHFRYDDDVPLIVPEVNLHALGDYKKRNIIANPNCSTIQMLVALKPIHDVAQITRINVATYQSVSGTGQSAIEELAHQTVELLHGREAEAKIYPKQIAFNVLPQIDVFLENGYTKEEMKMVWETQKILDSSIVVNPTCARVPVFHGHSEAVHIETAQKITAKEARDLLEKAPGIKVLDNPAEKLFATAVTDAANQDLVLVSRIREDISCEKGLSLWVVADNLRKGAATNSIQIASALIEQYF